MMKRVLFSKEIVDLETLLNFAQVIAQIIDFRSAFTSAHSSGVAAVARELAAISGFSERERSQMEIAGLLHDLGKLAVTKNILEKRGKLNKEEFNTIKRHTYYTFVILSKVNGLEDLAVWAAYHHERQDGNGYPFRVKEGDFPKMARVMAVADILTALTEDRPYRHGMDREEVMEILSAAADNGEFDKDIVELANRNFPRINDVRVKAQQEAREKYDAFQNNTDESGEKEGF
jgi:HD-GYP domain-containing protein (c-di-GMP phosphodiesterase class II)